MFSTTVVFLLILSYLLLLFLVAHYAEKQEKRGRSLVSNPYVYSLSLAVYCTSWTFYGSVGKAANSGLSFLTIYVGPTLMAALWWIVLRKIVYISKEYRITTISDFIAARYGKSFFLPALVTIVAVVGITPYLGLQIKAVMTTVSILSGRPEGTHFAGWFITLVLGIFAIIFGARRLDASERHGGLVFAIAFESAIKLIAFIAVGTFVTYWLFDGFRDIFKLTGQSEYGSHLRIGEGSHVSFLEWTSLTFLSMMAILFLPRQFHVSVVENSSYDHIKKAMWLFPLYLFLINIFVLPIAYGGLLSGGTQAEADYFVLSIPLKNGYPVIALIAFIGGFSAATAMVIVESLALSTMVMNSIVMPTFWSIGKTKGLHFLNIKRLVIIGCVFLGYAFAVNVGEFYNLVDIGLKSFEAVTIFAPAFLLGMYWKGGNRKGAITGILAGFIVWIYTLLIPALMRAGIIVKSGALEKLINSSFLNPTALFGLDGFDRWSHSLFWGLLLNVSSYVTVSLLTKQSDIETSQAISFVDSYAPLKIVPSRTPKSIAEIEETLDQYLGGDAAREVVNGFLGKNSLTRQSIPDEWLLKLRDEAEMVLSGAVGPAMGTLVFRDRTVLTPEEKEQISSSIREISSSLRLSRLELAEKNRQLALLKEFSENIIESIPLGVATLDSQLRVKYWNRTMAKITGVSNDEALGGEASLIFQCLETELFLPEVKEGEITCKKNPGTQPPMTMKVYISRLTGIQRGYVIVLEDITEKKKIEEELFRATKHASIGRLAAGVSHEIGNPLASISSLVQELLAEDLSPFAAHSLNTINQHVDRIARIVRNLGDFARLYPRQKVPTNIKEILENTINLVRYDRNFRKIEIRTDIHDVPAVKIDPDQMQQVFLNLMLNARDAMPEGGNLSISVTSDNGFVTAVFSDSGTGMDDEIRDKVFDPFFTTKGPVKGSGLGLSISYSIIRDHGGTIEIESEKGKGTSFTIRIPAK
ncbi:MAG: sodium:solute symporter family transporter [bacterium]